MGCWPPVNDVPVALCSQIVLYVDGPGSVVGVGELGDGGGASGQFVGHVLWEVRKVGVRDDLVEKAEEINSYGKGTVLCAQSPP